MKKVTKIKAKRSSKKSKHYAEYYLAAVLVGVLLLEGALFNVSTQASWSDAAEILDMSGSVKETSQQLEMIFEPMANVVSGVNEFYRLATDAAIELLDLGGSENGVLTVASAVNNFYSSAATGMAELLGISDGVYGVGQVSGISIEINR